MAFKKWLLLSSLLCACSSGQKSGSLANCREPSSEKSICSSFFNEKNDLLKQAQDKNSGLNQVHFTSTQGQVLKKGPDSPLINPKQVVSLFYSKYQSGHLNRGGVLVQGTPTEIILDSKGKPAYIIFANQPVRLLEYTAYMNSNSSQVIKGQNFENHPHGFSSPIGLLKGRIDISETGIQELKRYFKGLTGRDGITTLTFESGVVVKGEIESYVQNNSAKEDVPTVINFKKGTCKVTLGNRVLFDPDWGVYNMLVAPVIGETNGNADWPIYTVKDTP